MRNLTEIIKEMDAIDKHGDREEPHFKADALLLEAIRILAWNLNESHKAKADKLISSYEDIPKWFA